MVAKGYVLFILLDCAETMFKLHGSFLHYSLISVVTFICSDPNYFVQQFGSQRLSNSTFFPHPLPPRYTELHHHIKQLVQLKLIYSSIRKFIFNHFQVHIWYKKKSELTAIIFKLCTNVMQDIANILLGITAEVDSYFTTSHMPRKILNA